MGNCLLSALTICICLLFVTAHLQPAFAQTKKQSSGFLHLYTQIIVSKNNIAMPKATPTIYIRPTGTQLAVSPTIKPVKPTKPVLPTKPEKQTVPATESADQSGDPMSFIMSEINKYRSSNGLSHVQTSDETCSFAATRASEIVANFSHDGFQSRIDSKTLPYASWSSVTENIAMTSKYTEVVSMWINSPGHAANMRQDTPFVCVHQSGNYYAYVGMKP